MMDHLASSPRRVRAEELLNLVGLSEKMNRLPGQLSGVNASGLPWRERWPTIHLWCWLMNPLVHWIRSMGKP
jgi:hypothetical protein